ncbi:tetraacyldisaccharide 4'-kinase [Hyphomonas sp.]|uniref:tetraacyldisaccharide 4'-kinase n=1 Tax=Hyphomonas sp. TaxID=87 RepID=UPI00391AC472
MRPPHFWSAGLDPRSREAAPLTRALLTPLAALYLWGLERKLAKAEPVAAPVPVICIGNLTAGGAGKTPVTEAVRARLAAAGLRAASLSRGHGGTEPGPLRVDTAQHGFRQVGDEPLLLAASGEAWIGRDRVAAAQAMAADGVDVIVMDDGHQNPSLKKDVSLVVIDAGAPFGNGHVLPKGPLRETVRGGLARADAVVLVGAGPVPAEVSASGKPAIRAALVAEAPPPPGRLVAFAGIGRPEKFFDSLTAAGADLADAIPFPDHHAYSGGDLTFLTRQAEDLGAALVTTTKDHVRLPAETRAKVSAWPVQLRFEEMAALDAALAPILNRTSPR